MNMKKIIVMLLALLPLGMVAQELKIAFVKRMEIFNVMPEVSKMESDLAVLKTQYETNLKRLQDEYTQKMDEYMRQQDSLPENIKMLRVQEIENIAERSQGLQQAFYQDMEEQQNKMMAPIMEKMQKAIDQVGEENGYTVIIDSQVILYIGKTAIDATDKVKAKMGLK